MGAGGGRRRCDRRAGARDIRPRHGDPAGDLKGPASGGLERPENPAREGLPRRKRSDTAAVQSISGFVRSDSEPRAGPMKPLKAMAPAAVIRARGYGVADADDGRAVA